MNSRIIKFFCLIGLILTIISGGVFGWRFLSAQAGATYELGGWFWTDNYGWISLNSKNSEIADDPANTVPYKVEVVDDYLSGWGWSSNVGWVCFGKTCDPNNICGETSPCNPLDFGTAQPAGGWQAKIDSITRKIEGWAKIISLKDSGWIHLGMGTAPVAQNQKGEQCYDCQPHCDIWNYDNSDPPQRTTCNTYSTTVFDSCNSCFTRTKFDNINIPDVAVDSVIGGSGNTCFNCQTCQKIMSADAINSRIACNVCASCYLYGGALDSSSGASLGWAWNGNDDGTGNLGGDGAGWIGLNPSTGGAGLVYPWLETQYGTVFSSNLIKQKAAVSGANATYCIFAQDVFNFRSKNCEKNIPTASITFPQKDTASESYRNALGRLDIKGLSKVVKISTDGQKYNKYGNVVEEIQGNYCCCQSVILNNKVWVINGELVISSGCRLLNGVDGKTGNGSVIVNGDLRINGDFYYGSGVVSDLKQLASIAWIVRGDIITSPAVKNAVGAFIALGNDTDCSIDSGSSPDYPKYNLSHCGVFTSGNSDQPLVISGLLMAKAFNFNRTYSDISQGSEKIIYDGRLMANPPPGLKSLLEVLPVIRDFEF